MSESLDDVKRREEAKRDAVITPLARWRMLQQAMTWVENLPHVRRNTAARCLELERAKLAAIGHRATNRL